MVSGMLDPQFLHRALSVVAPGCAFNAPSQSFVMELPRMGRRGEVVFGSRAEPLVFHAEVLQNVLL